ncbi:terminase small subunit [Lysinibacillus sp. FSL M8-0355]|uniref:terminase small subunit n=1 Tax=Lysinibacillus sp. FSL M8-0355 TaxID=2921719 RepID=UPI0030F69954
MEEKELQNEIAKVRNELNFKQLRFCDAYLNNGGNATQAYREAGYNCSSDASYTTQASRLLKKAYIQKYINLCNQLNSIYCSLDRADVIRKLEHIITVSEFPIGQQLEAMKMLNQMNGWNAPEKSEVVVNTDDKLKRLSEMTTEEKMELLHKFENDRIEH